MVHHPQKTPEAPLFAQFVVTSPADGEELSLRRLWLGCVGNRRAVADVRAGGETQGSFPDPRVYPRSAVTTGFRGNRER